MPSFTREDSVIVTYTDDFDPDPGQFRYWIYPYSDPTYDLQAQQRVIDGLEVMPMAILRKDKTNIDTLYGTASNEYITTKLLMKRLDQDITAFLSAIATNPDQADIDDAYFNISMSPKDSHPLVSRLLYLSWYEMIVNQGLSSNVGEYTAKFSEGDIQNAIAWTQSVFNSNVVGVVADEGAYTHAQEGKWLYMRYQRTATNYDEIGLHNLSGMTAIEYDGYHEVALCALGDDEFTIPLSHQVYNRLTPQEMMEVYQHLFRLDFNAVIIQHLEWYETEAFFELFEIFMVVITLITLGASSGVSFALDVLYTYAVSTLLGELIIFIADETGNAALAALVGVVGGLLLSNPKMLNSQTLLNAEVLIDSATEFAFTLQGLEAREDMIRMGEELERASAEAQERIDQEKVDRPDDFKGVTVDGSFLAAVSSVNTSYIPAIAGQYDFDALYDYDMLVGNYVDQTLSIGIK